MANKVKYNLGCNSAIIPFPPKFPALNEGVAG